MTSMCELVIGSRGSKLALWQANHIAAPLEAAGHTTPIEITIPQVTNWRPPTQ